ncbi:hypothetical protein F5144DRAFT_327191 [Chaetomium tenue]|uniref:Uncharacterized protein n=1 Tax=Chaetomium tenue TaxID=1854479 RepID=A0ACB7P594_9PEZI|nr:hypothetical protein F5144DRAFT_327191 [Chaetomium globosum]
MPAKKKTPRQACTLICLSMVAEPSAAEIPSHRGAVSWNGPSETNRFARHLSMEAGCAVFPLLVIVLYAQLSPTNRVRTCRPPYKSLPLDATSSAAKQVRDLVLIVPASLQPTATRTC